MKKIDNEHNRKKKEMGSFVFHSLAHFFWHQGIKDDSWYSFSKEKILELIKDYDLKQIRGVGSKKEKMVHDYLGGTLPPQPNIKRKRYRLFGRIITITIKKNI
jgi:hypothetical protein